MTLRDAYLPLYPFARAHLRRTGKPRHHPSSVIRHPGSDVSRPSRIPDTHAGHALLILPSIRDELDPETKNALAIRNAASADGVCPDCGAEPQLYRDLEHERIMHLVFEHEPDCHALTDGAAA
jgi:hypothetical protein